MGATRRDDTPAKAARIAKSSEQVSPRFEVMTTQIDPKKMAELLEQAAAATSTREERATEQIQPIHLEALRDQAVPELGDSELDPRVVRALLAAPPPEDPPELAPLAPIEEPATAVRDRHRSGEVAPIARPRVALPIHPATVAWQRMIAFAIVIVAIVVLFVLRQ